MTFRVFMIFFITSSLHLPWNLFQLHCCMFFIVCQHHAVKMNMYTYRLGITKLLTIDVKLHNVLYYSHCILQHLLLYVLQPCVITPSFEREKLQPDPFCCRTVCLLFSYYWLELGVGKLFSHVSTLLIQALVVFTVCCLDCNYERNAYFCAMRG